ncbi:hypothetical protein SAMN05216198_2983 [Halopseudomonas litoralis]|uniref:Uncharacterized protein n=1 Tax=Halopseudomonas litoralis TaxID=797277 RepID=A0A1H1VN19_9GAMM|nr:hypothetical protein [Halopseudomonas litoralis]SDS86212.1 hypothetical protein SAMN05216198_2983 [Halopseudomonas litoralis]
MTGQTDDNQTARVQTPLHLLQVLARTLNDHLAEACTQAEADARTALEKLDREHQALQEKLDQAQKKQIAREQDGSEPVEHEIEELTTAMAALTQSRTEAQDYIRQLHSDVRQTLRLAKGLDRIDLQVTQAIEKRDNPSAQNKPAGRPSQRRSRNKKSATPPAQTDNEA